MLAIKEGGDEHQWYEIITILIRIEVYSKTVPWMFCKFSFDGIKWFIAGR